MAIHPDANVSEQAFVDDSVVVWAGTTVREYATIGRGTSLGQMVYVGPGAVIGQDCKIQNGAMIYEPAVVGDGVFIGPRVVFTNDRHPRAITPDGVPKSAVDWSPVGVTIEYGAAVGAEAVCVAPITIGTWSTVAAGAVVVSDVASFAIVAGIPAKQIGWIGYDGVLLQRAGAGWISPTTGDEFSENADGSGISPVGR